MNKYIILFLFLFLFLLRYLYIQKKRKDSLNLIINKEKREENELFESIKYINIEYLDKELACAILTNETDDKYISNFTRREMKARLN